MHGQFLVRYPEEKRQLGRPGSEWKNNMMTALCVFYIFIFETLYVKSPNLIYSYALQCRPTPS